MSDERDSSKQASNLDATPENASRTLDEVYDRRLRKTRDPELRWLLENLGAQINQKDRALSIAYQHMSEVFDGWTRMGLLKPKEEEK